MFLCKILRQYTKLTGFIPVSCCILCVSYVFFVLLHCFITSSFATCRHELPSLLLGTEHFHLKSLIIKPRWRLFHRWLLLQCAVGRLNSSFFHKKAHSLFKSLRKSQKEGLNRCGPEWVRNLFWTISQRLRTLKAIAGLCFDKLKYASDIIFTADKHLRTRL